MVKIRLTLRSSLGGEPLQQREFSLTAGGRVGFGRAQDNDFPIPDPEKKVSTRHGRIECRPDGRLCAVDAGSLNGTFRAGVPVDGVDGVVIASGDVLQVGDFDVTVELLPEVVVPEELDATMSVFDPEQRSALALQRLEKVFGEALADLPQIRAERLQAEVRRAVADLPPQHAQAVLESLARRVADPDEPRPAGELSQVCLEAMRGLAATLVPGSELRSPADAKRFAVLLQQVVVSALAWLGRSLRSRGVFAQEFGAEVTAMFQRTENPLKGLDGPELTAYLLDWTQNTSPEVRKHYLDAVLSDLAEHQMGLLAGVREAVGNVVAQLAPAKVMALAASDRGWSLASKSARAWETYEQLYAELFAERGKLFDEVISPAIQQGYLQQHQRPAGDGDKAGPPESSS
jgi:type VI secretion system protein ImpI